MARIVGLILLGLMGLWIAENPVPVSVVILGRRLPPWPLGLWMTIAFGVGAGLGAIARWVWPPNVSPAFVPPQSGTAPPSKPPEPKPPRMDEDDEEWWEEGQAESRDRSPEPFLAEEDEDEEDDEDTYLIARYIRR